jgi:outer membrane lipoprotein-sorting protein
MMGSFPILTFAAVLAMGAVVAAGPTDTDARPHKRGGSGAAATTNAATDADALIAQAAIAITRHATVSAKIRQRIELFNQQMVGSGTYLQGAWQKQLFRLELRIQVSDQVSTLRQVSDGEKLWIYRELLDKQSLERIDLAEVRKASAGATTGARQANIAGWLGRAGLPGLLDSLAQNFHFKQMENTTLGGVATVKLTGEWKPEVLAVLLPGQKEAIAAGEAPDLRKLRDQLPDQVVVWLGRDDLVPYRIDYRRRFPAAHTHIEAFWPQRATTLVAMEFFEVRLNVPIDPATFTYSPGSLQPVDATDSYLQRVGL